MIYFIANKESGEETHVAIVSPMNLESIMNGRPLVSPDGKFMLCYTPDIVWVTKRLAEILRTNTGFPAPEQTIRMDLPRENQPKDWVEEFDKVLKESLSRRIVRDV